MSIRQPMAFLSYVRSDDDHDHGRITTLRQRLEGEVKVQTGRAFPIFQDRNDISWGQQWAEAIRSSLAGVTFLIPVLTPSFFESPACRSELETFLLNEATLGTNRLILPLYYVTCDQLEAEWVGDDRVALEFRKRNWTDWRKFRFTPAQDVEMAAAVATLASSIKQSIKALESVISPAPVEAAAEHIQTAKVLSAPRKQRTIMRPPFSPEVHALRLPRKKLDLKRFAEIRRKHGYYAYTRQYDEEVPAHALSDDASTLALYDQVSRQVREIEQNNSSNELMAPPAKLAGQELSIAVALLVDNSGSLRRSGLTLAAAAWSTLISQWLEIARIPNEILGYTTRAWKGGQSREKWLMEGKPQLPGRLNDLRHIIYKAFDEDARTAAPNIAVMTRQGILKENIDGEALIWAIDRLSKHTAKKKVLFVLSDGAPVDDSTLSVNSNRFLLDHFEETVEWALQRPNLTIKAVGIGHDISQYFPNAPTVSNPNKLGLPILEYLTKELTQKDKTGGVRNVV